MSKDPSKITTRPTFMRVAVVVTAAVVAALGGGIAIAANVPLPRQATQAATVPSDFVGITPVRVLDTRGTDGGPIGVPAAGKLGQGATIEVAIGGVHGIPSNATGVILNSTLDRDATVSNFLTIYPTGQPRPNASLNNAEPGIVMANGGSFQLGTGGRLSVYNSLGQTHVIMDVTGYYVPATQPVIPPAAELPSAGNWGVLDRNTVGSPVADLRSGPSAPEYTGNPEDPFVPGGPVKGPPLGTGSLGLTVAGPGTEIAAYGNEIDFFSTPFNVTAVGFYVFNVPENVTAGPNNMPSIAFEIDPNVGGVDANYSTLLFQPNPTLPIGWSDFIDATSDTTGLWGLTSSAFNADPCGADVPSCTWTQIQTLLNDGGDAPTLFSVSIKKGRDLSWHGAVDGLRLNSTVYNFEEHGVTATPA